MSFYEREGGFDQILTKKDKFEPRKDILHGILFVTNFEFFHSVVVWMKYKNNLLVNSRLQLLFIL